MDRNEPTPPPHATLRSKPSSNRLLTCTRIHLPDNHIEQPANSRQHSGSGASLWSVAQNAQLCTFIRSSLIYSDHVVIAVEDRDHSAKNHGHHHLQFPQRPFPLIGAIENCIITNGFSHEKITVIPVRHWGQFTPALNLMLSFAAAHNYDRVLFQSLEVIVHEPHAVAVLLHELSDNQTLVAGAAFSQNGHLFSGADQSEMIVELNGCSSPWNTMAVWNTEMLARTGFLTIAEGLLKGVPAGVEEVTAIALQQHLYTPSHCKAKLVHVCRSEPTCRNSLQPIIDWKVIGFENDELRQQWHARKMASKLERPAAQLAILNLPPGQVIHKTVSF